MPVVRHVGGMPLLVIHRVVPEARKHSVPGASRHRLDFLILAKGEGQQQYGMELLAFGTPAQIDEHAKRAELYAELHATTSNEGQSVDCQMLVVNINDQPSAPSTRHMPPIGSASVRMVHVVLPGPGWDTAEVWLANATAPQLVQVQKPRNQGSLRLYRHSTD